MEHASMGDVSALQKRSDNLARLICKLRWIGLEEEARCLQQAAHAIPADERGTVSAGPPSTD